MKEHVILSEDEMEQLSEDERHRYLSNTDECNTAISTVFATYQATFSDAVLGAIDAGTLTASCFM